MENRSVIDDYKSGRQSTVPAARADAEHAQTTEYEWGSMTVYAVPYKDYPDLAQLSVVAKIPSSRCRLSPFFRFFSSTGRIIYCPGCFIFCTVRIYEGMSVLKS